MIDPFAGGTHNLPRCRSHECAHYGDEITITGDLEPSDGEIRLVVVERHTLYLTLQG